MANGTLLNYEAATSHSVTVRVTDRGGLTYDETFTITVTNVNEAPAGTNATVTINEDTTQTFTTANFGFSDGTRATASVRCGSRRCRRPDADPVGHGGDGRPGDHDGRRGGGNLVFTPAANANGTGYARFTFSVRDSNNAYDPTPNTLTVNVTAVNDAPTDLSLSASTVAENAANGTVVGTVTGSDVDAGDTKSYTLTNNAGGRFAINRTTGALTVANGTLLNYEAATSHSVTVRVTDRGGLTYDETFTITVTNERSAGGDQRHGDHQRGYDPDIHHRELWVQRCGCGRQLQCGADRDAADGRDADSVGHGGDGRPGDHDGRRGGGEPGVHAGGQCQWDGLCPVHVLGAG